SPTAARAAAASEEPPPRPAATAMDLWSSMWRGGRSLRSSAATAFHTRLSSSSGRSAPSTTRPSSSPSSTTRRSSHSTAWKYECSGWRPLRSGGRSLKSRLILAGASHSLIGRCLRQPHEVTRAQVLGPGLGIDPGPGVSRFGDDALKRTPQHLATLAERSAGYCDRLLPSWGRVDAVDADDRRLDLRGGDEHLGWHGETFYHPAAEGDHDRGDAVVGGARAGGEPVRDLLLDHDRHGGDLRDAHQHVEDERGSHVVGQFGDELPLVALQLGLQVCVHH